jgi:Tfp pilus assembly protein PilW
MKTKRQKGLALIELMMASVAATIVVVAAGTILFVGHTYWNKAWTKANLQRDASYAMLRMSRLIRAAKSAQPDSDGKALTINTEAGQTRFFTVAEDEKLTLKAETDVVTSMNDKVQDLQFNVDGNKVTIDLTLKEGDLQTHSVSTVMVRNYGG